MTPSRDMAVWSFQNLEVGRSSVAGRSVLNTGFPRLLENPGKSWKINLVLEKYPWKLRVTEIFRISCTKFGQLILSKTVKIVATGCHITVRHGSADTVVRAMNDFNGKCYFSGSGSSQTFWRIFKKFCTADYVGDPTQHANDGVNRFKGGVSAHAWNCRRQASIFFFPFLGPMRIATGRPTRPVGPINAVNGSNDASCWHSYSLYGLDNKN